MYGKHFASMYSGSLFGKPAIVFAVWGYAIANMRPSRKDRECYVEINPTLLAATFATGVQAVIDALVTLESPDPASRNTKDEGRRLILLAEQRHVGPMQYRVVNGSTYRAIRDEEERREQNRVAKQAERRRKTAADIADIADGQPPSAQVEGEVEAEGKSQKPAADVRRPTTPRVSARDLVEGLTISESLRDIAVSLGLNAETELEAFKDRMRGNGYKTNAGPVKDAEAAFRTHLRNAAKFARSGNTSRATGGSSADQFRGHFGNR